MAILGRYVARATGEDLTEAIVSAQADLIAPIATLSWLIGPDATSDIVMAALEAGSARAFERKRAEQ